MQTHVQWQRADWWLQGIGGGGEEQEERLKAAQGSFSSAIRTHLLNISLYFMLDILATLSIIRRANSNWLARWNCTKSILAQKS